MTVYTYNSPPVMGLAGTFYINGGKLSGAMPTPYNPHGGPFLPNTPGSAFVDAVRNLLPAMKSAGDLIVLDGEAITKTGPDGNAVADLDALKSCIDVTDAACPAIRRMLYGVFPGNFNIETQNALAAGVSNSATQALDAYLRTLAPYYAKSDYVDAGGYLLGPAWTARDLAGFHARAKLAKKYLPHCKIARSCRTLYPDGTMPDAKTLAKLAAALRADADAVIVFDATPGRDEAFVGMLRG